MLPPQVTAAVESLKDKVIALAGSELKKTQWGDKSERKPIEMWTSLAATVAGANQEAISKAFAQVLQMTKVVLMLHFIERLHSATQGHYSDRIKQQPPITAIHIDQSNPWHRLHWRRCQSAAACFQICSGSNAPVSF